MQLTAEERGIRAQNKFKEWLDSRELPYLFVDQSTETFATFFRDNIKRPDFLVLIPSISIIAVEVKSRILHETYETYTLEEEEVKKMMDFETVFRIPVWVAFSNDATAYRTWHWVAVSKIVQLEKKLNQQENKYFYAIPIKQCKTIGLEDGLAKLFGLYGGPS